MQYASNTDVSVEKSRAEIESVCRRYGATAFASGWQGNRAFITFEMRDRRIRFVLPLPAREECAKTPTGQKRHQAKNIDLAWEQACRQRWRALLLSIRAKLEAVESKISSFDVEMMPFVVLPNNQTIAETILPDLPAILAGRPMPPLLPGPVA